MAKQYDIIDYSTANPSPATIVAKGYRGVARYLAYLPNPKVIDAAEYKRHVSAGLSVILVWETTATAPLGGYTLGLAHAKEANRQANVLGHPSNRPIFYAVDFPVTDRQMTVVLEYLRGCADGGIRAVGVYGQASVIDGAWKHKRASFFWQTMAWSAGRISSHTQVLQVVGGIKIPDTDVNHVYAVDYGQHPAPGPVATPDTKGNDMTAQYVRTASGVEGYLSVTPSGVHALTGPEWRVLQDDAAKSVQVVSTAEWQALAKVADKGVNVTLPADLTLDAIAAAVADILAARLAG